MPHPPDPMLDRLLDAALPHVAFDGWSPATLARAAREAGLDPATAAAVTPNGARDLAVAWHRRLDRELVAELRSADLGATRFRDRVAHAVSRRIGMIDDAEALRRSMALFALPQNAATGSRLIWESADTIWTALGDTSRDGNWYTKRATLAGVIGSAVLYRLGDTSPGLADTRAFIDRRVGDVMAIETAKARARESRWLSPVARAFDRAMGMVHAPVTPPEMPGLWRE